MGSERVVLQVEPVPARTDADPQVGGPDVVRLGLETPSGVELLAGWTVAIAPREWEQRVA